jgi:two-component system nitrogen regulation response regulator GlnG
MPVLLVIDDEAPILLAFQRAFRATDFEVLTAGTGSAGLDLARRREPDVVVLDVDLPDLPGLEVFRRLRAHDPQTPVLFITGKAGTNTAIEAMRDGAFDCLYKPLELAQLRQQIDRAVTVRRLTEGSPPPLGPPPTDDLLEQLVGRCPAMQEVYKAIGRVAGQEVTVLITGETGTGKELVARATFQHSRRATKPFLAINCAAIPEQLLESELFGHEKGAFTGADRRRVGKFEQCTGGTLFLDEIGDMSPLTQAKVLRLIQEQRFERLGGDETIQADVRILAATNQDLEALVARGAFRQDLYYRLSVFTIELPPLRQRGADLPLLVQHYLMRFSRELSKETRAVSPEALARLEAYAWPGNVRELQSVLKQALLRAAGPILLPEHLPATLNGHACNGAKTVEAPAISADSSSADLLEQFLDERLTAQTENLYAESLAWLERRLFMRVLRETAGNQRQSARLLGITRGYLRKKLRAYGISVDKIVREDEGDD